MPRYRIYECAVYHVEAENAEAAKRIYLGGPMEGEVEVIEVTERTIERIGHPMDGETEQSF